MEIVFSSTNGVRESEVGLRKKEKERRMGGGNEVRG